MKLNAIERAAMNNPLRAAHQHHRVAPPGPDWPAAIGEIARVLRPGGLVLFEEVPRHTLDTWLFRTFTDHPRENRFEADEFAEELAHHGLQPTDAPERHFAGHAFAG